MPYEWQQNPNAEQGYRNLERIGAGARLGLAGRMAKRGLRDFASGNYDTGIIGTMLNPIRDAYAVSQREMDRNAHMGANAFQQGAQPALMASIANTARLQNTEGLGMAMSSAVPQAYSALVNQYQGALNDKRNLQLGAYQSAMQGRLGSGQFTFKPGFWDRFSQVLGAVGQATQGVGSLATGFR